MKKRIIFALLSLLILSTSLFLLAACTQKDANNGGTYIISFNTDGGSEVPSIVLNAGASIELPEPPVKPGYVFIGWFNDKDLKRRVNVANFRANSNATIFAGWESVETYPHAITADVCENGSIKIVDPYEARASKGTEVRVTVSPVSEAYEVVGGSVRAVGETQNIALTEKDRGIYYFTMPAEPVTIVAEFTEKAHAVSLSPFISHGTIALSADAAKQGETVSVRAIPDYGYRLTDLYLLPSGDISMPVTIDDNIFEMRPTDVVIFANFSKIDYDTEYTVTVSVKGEGELKLSSDKVAAGVFVAYKAIPDTGYRLLSLNSQNVTLDDEGFIMPEYDVYLTAEFVNIEESDDKYAVSFSSSGGTVSTQRTTYASGELVELALIADQDYEIGTVSVNGAIIEGNAFIMPAEATLVVADFVKRGHAVEFSGAYSGFIGNVSAQYAYEGDLIRFEVQPKADYVIKSVTLIVAAVGSQQSTSIALNTNHFVMPDADVIIEVKTVATNFSFGITIENVENGIIEIPGTAKYGDIVSLNVISEEGYRLKGGSLKVKYLSSGNEVIAAIGNSFRMPASDVVVLAEFERFYTVGCVDEECVAVYPSVTEIAVGEKVKFTVTVRGDYVANSVYLTVTTSSGYMAELGTDNIFEMTEENAGNVNIVYDKTRYATVDSMIYERNIIIDKVKGGSISVPKMYNVKYGTVVPITVTPQKGYKLKNITLYTRDSSYSICDVFTMPAMDAKLIAEFESKETLNESLSETYLRLRDNFYSAGIFLQYYREAYQLRDFFGGNVNSMLGYIDSVLAAYSSYGHDFFVIEVKSLMKLNAIVQGAVSRILAAYPEGTEADVNINYNCVVVSIGGNAEEDAAMLANGVSVTDDSILYVRDDDTYGLYAYTGNAKYVNVLPMYSGRIVSYIAPRAFMGAGSRISGISLGNVSELDDFALMGLNKIRYVYLGNVSKVGKGVFVGCDSLSKIGVSKNNSVYSCDSSGVLYEKNALKAYPAGSDNVSYKISGNCNEICDYAFYGANKLTRLGYYGSLQSIGDYAFYGATALESIHYSNVAPSSIKIGVAELNVTNSNISYIGNCAFLGCDSIKEYRFDKINYMGSRVVEWRGDADCTIYLNTQNVIYASRTPIKISVGENAVGTLAIRAGVLTDDYKAAKHWNEFEEYLVS